MQINDVIWKTQFIEKLDYKHGVSTEEVEQILLGDPLTRKVGKGKMKAEDLYVAYGQTDSGRYLTIIFIRKGGAIALPISARDMNLAERRYYAKK